MAALFHGTVHTVNAGDYTPDQLRAWAPGTVDLAAWDASLSAHHALVAEEGVVVGFGDIDAAGYLDRLYVHKDYQRRHPHKLRDGKAHRAGRAALTPVWSRCKKENSS